MMTALLYAGVAATTIYVALCALLYLLQDRLLYLPTPDVTRQGARPLRLRSGAATLKVWELHADRQAALLYFGGNAEDVSANLGDFDLAFPDRALFLVNYRGYGGSTGRPSEAALIADAEVIYDWVSPHHDRIAVMGRSLGTGVAITLATRRPVERLALVTPYDSITNVATDHFGWLPVALLLRDHYDSLARIPQVRAPVLALVAERDEVVRRVRSDALIAAVPPSLGHRVVVAGATHNDISAFPDYWRSLRTFLAAPNPSAPR
jgi:uncharacterized protein